MPLMPPTGDSVVIPPTAEELAYAAKQTQLAIDQKTRAEVKRTLIAARNARGNMGFNPHYGRSYI